VTAVDIFPRLADALRVVVNHRDRPCPPLDVFADWLDLSFAETGRLLLAIERAGFLEVEVIGERRRMRIVDGQWTGWGTSS
jgi:hypothetical protein